MDERTPLLPSTPAAPSPRHRVSPARYVALLIPPALFGVYVVLSTLLAGTPAGLAVEQPSDRAGDLIPFPFDRPFVCPLDHSHDPPNRWRVITHNASCAVPDPAPRRSEAPELVAITHVDETGALVDGLGRQRLLRGFNVAAKRPPYLPMTDRFHPSLSFSRSDVRLLASLGLNVIRLSVPWAAVQPTDRDTFDEAYLDAALSLVRQSAQEGLYVCVEECNFALTGQHHLRSSGSLRLEVLRSWTAFVDNHARRVDCAFPSADQGLPHRCLRR